MKTVFCLILLGGILVEQGVQAVPVPCLLPEQASFDDFVQYYLCMKQNQQGQHQNQQGQHQYQHEVELKEMAEGAGNGNSVSVDDDGATPQFVSNLDYGDIYSFKYCTRLNAVDCRVLLTLLDGLVTLTEEDGIVANADDGVNEMQTEEPRAKRSASDEEEVKTETDDGEMRKIVRMYRKWRRSHGYKKEDGRWGKALSDLHFLSDLYDADAEGKEEQNTITRAKRTRRAVLTKLPKNLKAILRAYKQWRNKHGYGKAVGRWG